MIAIVGSAPLVAGLYAGRIRFSVAYALAPSVLLTMLAIGALASRIRPSTRTLITTWVILVGSTFVWRARTTAQLNSNPLDAAGMLRVAFVSVAGLVALGFFTRRRVQTLTVPPALRWFGIYVLVALTSVATSPVPLQALYRVVEFSVAIFAIVIVALCVDDPVRPRVLFQLAQVTIVSILAVVWLEAIAVPRRAWETSSGIDPFTLHGYLPSYASNSVGTYGGLLALMSLPFARQRGTARTYYRICVAAGVITLFASQYRTGIVALVIAAPLVLRQSTRVVVAAIVAAGIVAVLAAGQTHRIVSASSTAFAKGRPELVGTLDSRTTYWKDAIGYIRQRPEIGWGLNVGTRRALVSLGDESTSTIHGTWIEALLGTGLIGTLALALSYLTAFSGAWSVRVYPIGAGSVGVIAFLMIRSITGTTIELFSDVWMFFAVVVLATYELSQQRLSHLDH